MAGTSLLLFFRPLGSSPLEQLVDAARAATMADTVARAHEAGFDRVELATPCPERFDDLPNLHLHRSRPDAAFGEVLNALLEVEEGEAVCLAGCGMPAMTGADWGTLREQLDLVSGALVNNLYSPDIVATRQIGALRSLPPDAADNALGLHLRDVEEIEVQVLPRSARTLLDIDTPADLLVLSAATAAASLELGPALTGVLVEAALDIAPLLEAVDCFTEREREVLVVGRVGSSVWEALEKETAARTRVISEERGLRARVATQPRSILGFHADAAGPKALAEAIGELADAAFIDARPLYLHLGWGASRADRFNADLRRCDEIAHPQLRAFCEGLTALRIPAVLGGHSLVSGGLLAAIDIAWSRWEQQDPEPRLPK